ncbi:MAG: sialate O-acetylesterase, partial [Victivallales bacterium]|nr:sialate O-acetylesterase [Victivallales bacterium]
LVKTGPAVLAVRVFDHCGAGGFCGDREDMYLRRVDTAAEKIGLSGPWKYRVGIGLKPKIMPRHPPYGPGHPWLAGGLFNGMILPLAPYGLKGVVWYQGENNTSRAWKYRALMPAVIDSWRQAWKRSELPFLVVQLAGYHRPNQEPVDSSWAELREAQAVAAGKLPACALVTALDIGETSNMHPKNKQEVGYRLALAAQRLVYGQDLVAFGPEYAKYAISDGKIVITFNQVGSGLMVKGGGALQRFQIAGSDHKFVWADARISGKNQVIVSSPVVSEPVAVRYAWSDNPQGANLYNRQGLPATPFRTDNWRLTTFKSR